MKLKKISIIFLIIIVTSFVLQINIVQAALQSNGDTPSSKNRNTWLAEVRKMESLGGTLGLTETQNTDLTSIGDSNNLDIHMQKNTEYGAMALLSASSYGKSDKVQNGQTTTGNESGVLILYNNEWVAAHYNSGYLNENVKGHIADRYINYYDDNEKKSGDATIETAGWHNSFYGYNYGYGYNFTGSAAMCRRLTSGVFGFSNTDYNGYGGYWAVYGTSNYASRAVIINGEGV